MTGEEQKETRVRLMDAAESLFGEHGFGRVSVRDITKEAGANVAAVNYHFGGKESLLEAVCARRMDPINVARIEMLDELEAAAEDGIVPIEDVLRSLLHPMFRVCIDHPDFMRFCARLHTEPLETRMAFFRGKTFGEVVTRFRAAAKKSLPAVSVPEVWWGTTFVFGGMLHTWASWREVEEMSGGEARFDGMEALEERLIRFGAAGLRGLAGGRP